MIISYHDELICDLAEFYHIYEYETWPPLFIATLACGLRDGSRVVSALNDVKFPLQSMLLAGISDRIGQLVWMNSEDGRKNINRPDSILDILLGKEKKEERKIRSFDSGAEFEAARLRIINGE